MSEDATGSAPPFDAYTIGHSNHPIERFLALLRGTGVSAVVDVRSQPVSRRYPWFSASRLREHLQREGFSYVPMGDCLGGRPRDPGLYRDGIAVNAIDDTLLLSYALDGARFNTLSELAGHWL